MGCHGYLLRFNPSLLLNDAVGFLLLLECVFTKWFFDNHKSEFVSLSLPLPPLSLSLPLSPLPSPSPSLYQVLLFLYSLITLNRNVQFIIISFTYHYVCCAYTLMNYNMKQK